MTRDDEVTNSTTLTVGRSGLVWNHLQQTFHGQQLVSKYSLYLWSNTHRFAGALVSSSCLYLRAVIVYIPISVSVCHLQLHLQLYPTTTILQPSSTFVILHSTSYILNAGFLKIADHGPSQPRQYHVSCRYPHPQNIIHQRGRPFIHSVFRQEGKKKLLNHDLLERRFPFNYFGDSSRQRAHDRIQPYQ